MAEAYVKQVETAAPAVQKVVDLVRSSPPQMEDPELAQTAQKNYSAMSKDVSLRPGTYKGTGTFTVNGAWGTWAETTVDMTMIFRENDFDWKMHIENWVGQVDESFLQSELDLASCKGYIPMAGTGCYHSLGMPVKRIGKTMKISLCYDAFAITSPTAFYGFVKLDATVDKQFYSFPIQMVLQS